MTSAELCDRIRNSNTKFEALAVVDEARSEIWEKSGGDYAHNEMLRQTKLLLVDRFSEEDIDALDSLDTEDLHRAFAAAQKLTAAESRLESFCMKEFFTVQSLVNNARFLRGENMPTFVDFGNA